MKVRIDMTLQVDPDRWKVVRGLPEDTKTQVRQAIKSWVESEIVLRLVDEGILVSNGQ